MISKVRFFMKSDLGVAWIFFLRMVGGLCRANRSQPPATRCMCSSLVFLKVLYEHHCYRKYCYWSGSIANHRGETAEQTEEGRITIYASICFPCRIFRSKSSPPSPGRASNPSVGGIPVPGRACQQKVLRESLIRLLARALPQSSSRLCACSKPQPLCRPCRASAG